MLHNTTTLRRVLIPTFLALLAAANAQAQDIEVLYTKIDASPTSDIPGTLDLNGQPAPSKWRAIEDFTVSHDGTRWVLKGRTRLGSDMETILILGDDTGTGAAINMAQEGQPVPGDAPGILWDFFDSGSPASFDSSNNIGLSARSKGGATGTRERIMKRDTAGNWTIVLREGDPLFGLTDTPPSSAGDEALGNSVSGVHLLDDGRVGYIVTPIQNCSSFNYPAFLHDDQGFLQTGASMLVGGETWDGMDLGDSGGTPDGAWFYTQGDTENSDTSIDDVFTVNNTIMLQEGSPIVGGAGPIYADAFQSMMAASGDWAVRGDDPNNDDWAMVSGMMVARTADYVEVGGTELWGDSFSSIACNSVGDWALVGKTDEADNSKDHVLVVNGTVTGREGDPVDLDGNGLFDDGAYIGDGSPDSSAFAANDLAITDSGMVYFIAALNDGAGNDLNDAGFGGPDAFLRMQLDFTHQYPFCFGNLGSGTPCPCGNDNDGSVPGSGCANGVFASGARLSVSGTASLTADTLVLAATGLEPSNSGLYFQANNDLSPGNLWGDGLQCAGGQLKRLGVRFSDTAGYSDTSGYPQPISVKAGNINAGDTKYYQCWYRNPTSSPCGSDFNASNGFAVTWAP